MRMREELDFGEKSAKRRKCTGRAERERERAERRWRKEVDKKIKDVSESLFSLPPYYMTAHVQS